MGEVRVYNRVLNAEEIKARYEAGNTATGSPDRDEFTLQGHNLMGNVRS